MPTSADVLCVRMGVFGGFFTLLATYFGSWPALLIALAVTLFLNRV